MRVPVRWLLCASAFVALMLSLERTPRGGAARGGFDTAPDGSALFSFFTLKATTTPGETTRGNPCPDDMLEVEGEYCPGIEQRCLRWLDPDATIKLQCAEFATTGRCLFKTTHKHFCIDRYEWPNIKGERPWVGMDWFYAKRACADVGKRLCLDSEWTQACEGNERLPYPYGYTRNKDVCNIDKTWRKVDFQAYANLSTRVHEIERLDQSEPIGARESCVSPYGVHDMSGNVDEWVVNELGKPYRSGLKGGYWGPVRARCRPMTTAHEEKFSFYQVGFRCCADTKSQPVASRERPRSGPSINALVGNGLVGF